MGDDLPNEPVRIYVSGPYTVGDTPTNVARAILVGDYLYEMGYASYVPHLTLLCQLVRARPYEDWIDFDLTWLKVCDGMIRLPGKSPGADREQEVAEDTDIPVFHSIGELTRTFPPRRRLGRIPTFAQLLKRYPID
jgi:hypothetical protein